jgi:ribonuclease E
LVLRRLTEALARDRTRHQVSEVTSLGLVQLTRKRLGTGLIEAFSTSCQHCAGRGIMLHADPVDSAAPGRRSEPGSSSRRSKRSKKPKVDEPTVAKVPVHTPGDHPMFKAMAAATDRHDDESEDGADDEATAESAAGEPQVAVELEPQVAGVALEDDSDDSDDEAYDEDSDADEDADDPEDDSEDDDDDEVDLDDDDDEDFDDDLDVTDESEESEEDEDSEEEFEEADVPAVAFERPRRRRAAARPAGPPI